MTATSGSGTVSRQSSQSGVHSILGDPFDEIVVVLSTGRTATKAIAHYFDRHYELVHARHEPAPSRILRLASNLYLAGRISHQSLRWLLVRCRRRMLADIQEPIYLETNPFLHGCLEVLEEVFGRVRVWHIVRHPGRQVTSYINFGVFDGLKGIAGSYLPFWLHKPEHSPETLSPSWNAMAETDRLAWRWNSINGHLNRGEQLFPGRYSRVKYEELFTPAAPAIEQLARSLGLEPTPQSTADAFQTRIHASHRPLCPPWEDWEDEPRQRLLDHCEDLMRLYGYEA